MGRSFGFWLSGSDDCSNEQPHPGRAALGTRDRAAELKDQADRIIIVAGDAERSRRERLAGQQERDL
jgi:hypothetical protein